MTTRLFCGMCKRETHHCESLHCLEHDGWKEVDGMKHIIDGLRAELSEWKQKWARAQNRLVDVADFYGDPIHWQPDESDNIIAHYDHGKKARETLAQAYKEEKD